MKDLQFDKILIVPDTKDYEMIKIGERRSDDVIVLGVKDISLFCTFRKSTQNVVGA
ncbi:hypothetical protein LCGC14_1388290 [marine sediment metagenome]|uniref:Uncharacterized protein n=1 Tax=marine sediment metagenome TaxID=412755 RepID=A0A0F9K0Q7_9ZZZZ